MYMVTFSTNRLFTRLDAYNRPGLVLKAHSNAPGVTKPIVSIVEVNDNSINDVLAILSFPHRNSSPQPEP
jgi:hypothetical protein